MIDNGDEMVADIPKPSVEEVKKYLEEWKTLGNYVNQENSLDKLFFSTSRLFF